MKAGRGEDRIAAGGPARHVPVLLAETLGALVPRVGAVIVDGTFGAGGYSRALLESGARVVAIDRDPAAIAGGAPLVAEFTGRLTLAEGRFAELDAIARGCGFDAVDGVALDIGVSSMQIDEAERGFSLRFDGPLDMRMSRQPRESHGEFGATAQDILRTAGLDELARIFRVYGEEKRARAIAREIVAERQHAPLETTTQLARMMARVLGPKRGGIHPATRVFQALRIAVNDELGNLKRGLEPATQFLKSGARIAVISFHSLEDRIVKQFFVEKSTGCTCPTDLPACTCGQKEVLRIVTRKPVTADDVEVRDNPRARSAKLRVAERI